jgi:hypothetical protein
MNTPARTIQEARENLAKLRAQRALKPAVDAMNRLMRQEMPGWTDSAYAEFVEIGLELAALRNNVWKRP